ncbi:hypothetical protein [Pseudolactococcus insecticola]|uniref:Uncharacterized protein n=1 Tax=Pseudolactococcus insecticola TaxID=2709158 RepID=A0A6A0B3G2_9LACT|nr:hypothetical protein [Lactococcus insecticola]GFH39860.1 hypothetical protein Hs20B_02580 [Lactococcus insecticola]
MNKLIQKYETALRDNETPKVDKRTTFGRYLKQFDKYVQYSDGYLLGVVKSGWEYEHFNEIKYTLHNLKTGQNWRILATLDGEFKHYGDDGGAVIDNITNTMRGLKKYQLLNKNKETLTGNDIQEMITGFNSGDMI